MVPRIGRGIRTTRVFKRHDVLLRYFGEVVSEREASRRLNAGPTVGHFYRYTFRLHEKPYVLDATPEDGTFARLVNHSKKNPNVYAKAIDIGGTPGVILVAACDIPIGTELRYDYGVHDKEVLEANPWLKK